MLRVKPDGLSANALLPSIDYQSKTALFDTSTDIIVQQLRDEQKRNDNLEDLNDMFKEQTEIALQTNHRLKDDLMKAQEALKKLIHEREIEQCLIRQDKEKTRRTMDRQHQNMLELWIAFNGIQRQVRTLRTETENDLDRQRTEFLRAANNMEAVIRQTEMKRKSAVLEGAKTEGIVDELLRKHEDLAVRNIKLEHSLRDSNRRISCMESLIKKITQERDAAKDSVKRIQSIPELDEIRGRRARSISPGLP
ncbi:unnamed protein product [Thelazia callipaeda]|uniref:Cilia- and flagella-associated protein 157 n=1 Tax=Thelazia callipaeda TaxID=103827 RepID=A0A0N5D9Y8_THECL|nr:unnamed protein product [Thelazia callipaeda]